jgi:hypothetical protein
MISWYVVCWPRGPWWMKDEVRPMTMTTLDHCRARVSSCSGRAIVVVKLIVVSIQNVKGAIRLSVTRLR